MTLEDRPSRCGRPVWPRPRQSVPGQPQWRRQPSCALPGRRAWRRRNPSSDQEPRAQSRGRDARREPLSVNPAVGWRSGTSTPATVTPHPRAAPPVRRRWGIHGIGTRTRATPPSTATRRSTAGPA